VKFEKHSTKAKKPRGWLPPTKGKLHNSSYNNSSWDVFLPSHI